MLNLRHTTDHWAPPSVLPHRVAEALRGVAGPPLCRYMAPRDHVQNLENVNLENVENLDGTVGGAQAAVGASGGVRGATVVAGGRVDGDEGALRVTTFAPTARRKELSPAARTVRVRGLPSSEEIVAAALSAEGCESRVVHVPAAAVLAVTS